jgi:nucleoside-diphosphate-sugar epimerase
VEDFVEGIRAMLESDLSGPVNLGSENEISMSDLACTIVEAVGAGAVEVLPAVVADSTRRCPDTGLARAELGWTAHTSIETGIRKTAERMERFL